MANKKIRLTEGEFFAILRENAGLYSRTANAIREKYGIEFSRQAVRQRAEKNPEELADIREQNIDIAEDGLHSLMQSTNERVKLNAIELYLKTIGKHRGYVERSEFTGAGGKDLIPQRFDNLTADQIEEILKKNEPQG